MPTQLADEELTTQVDTEAAPDELVSADLLIEDVSIDGMCGVY